MGILYVCVSVISQDEALQKRLHESQREGEKMMEAVVEEFVARQEQLQETSGQQSLEGDSCSANEEEEEEEEEEKEEEEEEKEGGGGFVATYVAITRTMGVAQLFQMCS